MLSKPEKFFSCEPKRVEPKEGTAETRQNFGLSTKVQHDSKAEGKGGRKPLPDLRTQSGIDQACWEGARRVLPVKIDARCTACEP